MRMNYTLSGDVNNSRVKADGTGEINFLAGEYGVDLIFQDIPMQWDPAFSFLMTDTASAFSPMLGQRASSLATFGTSGYIVNWRGAYIYDESGRHVGHITASSKTTISDDEFSMHSEIHHGYTYLHLDEKVIEIETPYKGIVLPTEMADMITFSYKFLTDKGNRYWGWTTYPYISNNGVRFPSPHIITVERVSFTRSTNADKSELFSYSRTSRIDPL